MHTKSKMANQEINMENKTLKGNDFEPSCKNFVTVKNINLINK